MSINKNTGNINKTIGNVIFIMSSISVSLILIYKVAINIKSVKCTLALNI